MRWQVGLTMLLAAWPAVGAARPASVAGGKTSAVIVRMRGELEQVDARLERKARRRQLLGALHHRAERHGPGLEAWLRKNGAVRVESLWAINALRVELPAELLEALRAHPAVASVSPDVAVTMSTGQSSALSAGAWNVAAVQAPAVWGLGFTGQGVVVASLDTGVDALHPDLSARYRGGAGAWYDPHAQHASPYDADGHGTQALGVIVGEDASGQSIGVAPGAQWIAAKVFDDAGSTTYARIHQALQWLLDPDGDPNTDDAPDIASNAWGLIGTSGTCMTEFDADLVTLRTAGVLVVFAAGNSGPAAGSSLSPANNGSALAVGSLDINDAIGSQSSRGPSACDGSVYPHLSAPGEAVTTADLTFNGLFPFSYATVSGTSFAVGHVAGVAALLKSAAPAATLSDLEQAMLGGAVDLGASGPDNTFGAGRVDAIAAYAQLTGGGGPVDADGDGYDVNQDCDDTDASVHPGAPEVIGDGVDQDCNGYDLSLVVTKAQYQQGLDKVVVWATGALGAAVIPSATFDDGLGHTFTKAMTYNASKGRYQLSMQRFSSKAGFVPTAVTVASVEGVVSAPVVLRP